MKTQEAKQSHYPNEKEFSNMDNLNNKRNTILQNLETRLDILRRIEVRKRLTEDNVREYHDLEEVIKILKQNIR